MITRFKPLRMKGKGKIIAGRDRCVCYSVCCSGCCSLWCSLRCRCAGTRKGGRRGEQWWTLLDAKHTATRCNTPRRIATHCNTLQHTRKREGRRIAMMARCTFWKECTIVILQSTCSSELPIQNMFQWRRLLQHACNTLQRTATHGTTL